MSGDDRIAVRLSEAARMLGFADSRPVRRLIAEGRIRAKRVGRRAILVSVESLREFMGDGRESR